MSWSDSISPIAPNVGVLMAGLVSGKYAWTTWLVVAGCAAITSLAEGRSWHIPAGRLVMYALIAMVFINIGTFSINMFGAMRRCRQARTEGELASIAIPAIRGELTSVPQQILKVSALLVAACLGIIVGALAATLVRLFV